MTTLEVLRAARALVATGWTQGADARDAQDNEVSARNASAVCWCLGGAIERAGGPRAGWNWGEVQRALGPFIQACEEDASLVVAWNDAHGRTQADVLATLDRAISRLEAP